MKPIRYSVRRLVLRALFALPAPALLAPAGAALASDLATFSAADRDRDGRVSAAEFRAAFPWLELEALRMADDNADGALDRAEFIAGALPVAGARLAAAPGVLDMVVAEIVGVREARAHSTPRREFARRADLDAAD